MKKRILFVVDSLACGGAEKSLVSLLSLLDYSRIEVDLLIGKRGGVFERYLPQSVRILALPSLTGWAGCRARLCALWLSVQIRIDRLRGKKRHGAESHWQAMHPAIDPLKAHYDVAVAYHQGFPTYYVATKVDAHKKYAWVNADLQQAGYDEAFNRLFYACFDGVCTVSEKLCELLEHTAYVDPAKLCTVYDIIHVELIRQMAGEYGFGGDLPADTFRIVTVGRMTPPKNYTLAVETARRLKAHGLKFRWWFVGDGSERAAIEGLIERYALQDDIVLVGMHPNPYPYMSGCDLYVQTSSFEGFCLTLREARLLHKPVVSTDFSVVYDQIRDGENGLIARMTPESLAEKILLLANDPALRARLIAATRLEEDRTMSTELEKIHKMLLAG